MKTVIIILLTSIIIITIGLYIFFNISYSKTKTEFNKKVSQQIATLNSVNDEFTYDDIDYLPLPVKRYFEYCGYIGTPKMSYMVAKFKDVDFIMLPNKPKLKIDYTQYNFVNEPNRLAFIDTALYGVPFQGIDSYIGGSGNMKGVIAKSFNLFNQHGQEMDQASLVTVLAESLVIPNVALQNYIIWESVDDTHVKAKIAYKGISASGIFTFSKTGEALSFTTKDRAAISTDGVKQKIAWSAVYENYKKSNGIMQPTVLKAVWHYKSGDVTYFDGRDVKFEYSYNFNI
ncbi:MULTISPECIES: DUF6544 family protein [Bacillus cereus group]|uniref:Uncharacterized protein n=1 Tax=Bacillus wiedmannii TaxID=1890302 RepID=A0A2A8DLB9_9BACI|nr:MULTISPECIES: DUF6544 family protein [Bacillus cereus group]EJP84968.1 hypothetical protein IC3_04790 [Bacillus cereus VD142]PEN43604.1 hypothetical protein CN630_25525 [Bacillus wiedmannii]PHD56678.1 hypothetical protein COF57_26530 [Bacillus wiedmannii]WOA60852.1 DUF6544 family protein [Bacillus mycoides]